MGRFIRYTLTTYILLTIAFLIFSVLLWLRADVSLNSLARLGPGTNSYSLITSIVLNWVLVGIILVMARLNKVNVGNILGLLV